MTAKRSHAVTLAALGYSPAEIAADWAEASAELDQIASAELRDLRLSAFRFCGLSADWCVSAWHVCGEYLDGSGVYIVDDENGTFSLVRRTYSDGGNGEFETLASWDEFDTSALARAISCANAAQFGAV